MPLQCSASALTGQTGSVYYQPAGTDYCLKDFTDFPAGNDITVPVESDYQIGDPVTFAAAGAAALDTALTDGTTYYVVALGSGSIQVAAAAGGTAITLNGDGGTGSADTSGVANHINVTYAEWAAIASVNNWSLSIEREQLDVTTLPAGVTNSSKYAPSRAFVPGYATYSGTMALYFSDNPGLGARLQSNILLKSQAGAKVRLFNNTVSDGAATPAPDLAASSWVEGDITMTSLSFEVSPDDPQQGEVEFTLENLRQLFTTSL
nr:phage major tail protein 2 [uncultured Mediterranean phage uvMED]